MEVIECTKLEFNDTILFVKYESFSSGFDIDESFNEGFCAKYESFSFDPLQPDFLVEPHKSEFVESEAIVDEIFYLDRTLTPLEIRRLVDFQPTSLPRLLIPTDNHISRLMTTLLANTEHIYLLPN